MCATIYLLLFFIFVETVRETAQDMLEKQRATVRALKSHHQQLRKIEHTQSLTSLFSKRLARWILLCPSTTPRAYERDGSAAATQHSTSTETGTATITATRANISAYLLYCMRIKLVFDLKFAIPKGREHRREPCPMRMQPTAKTVILCVICEGPFHAADTYI